MSEINDLLNILMATLVIGTLVWCFIQYLGIRRKP